MSSFLSLWIFLPRWNIFFFIFLTCNSFLCTLYPVWAFFFTACKFTTGYKSLPLSRAFMRHVAGKCLHLRIFVCTPLPSMTVPPLISAYSSSLQQLLFPTSFIPYSVSSPLSRFPLKLFHLGSFGCMCRAKCDQVLNSFTDDAS